MIEPDFRWPDSFRPDQAAVFVRNMRHIEQPADWVWQTLVRARSWPSWYESASNVTLPGDAAELAPGMIFTWKQTGIRLQSEVREFEPPHRLAWFAQSPWVQAYHAWDIQPAGDACTVVTDETQRGVLPRVLGPLFKRKMLAIHERWLERLEMRSGTTEDMSVPLPPGRTAADVVERVLAYDPPHDVEAVEAMLRAEFGLSDDDAALARDRALGGVTRAATGNILNRPDRIDDPIAWASFERAWKDPSIVARFYPDPKSPSSDQR